jgi:alkanesulfonate monooxygenase SsuD/methylene tetrahydromethanopterin reductase-like flavin-dependent oxidoreductase (luciferase family)
MEFGDEGQSLGRLTRAADAARECEIAALSANDHFLFQTPWLDGPTALAAVIDRSGATELATTVSLVALRGPVLLAKTLAALDLLSDGRVIAGVGPGSSERDYEAIGVPYEERWKRFDEATAILRALVRDEPPPPTLSHSPCRTRRWRRVRAGRAESQSGLGAGARRWVSGASLAWATGGSHPRTTQRLSASRARSARCRRSCALATAIPIGSPTHS